MEIQRTQLKVKPRISKIRRIYLQRLIARIGIFLICLYMTIFKPESLDVLRGMNFFKQFSIFHILWAFWMIDMVWQLIPAKKHIALGSQKLFKFRFVPSKNMIPLKAVKAHVIETTKSAYKVFVIWAIAIIGITAARLHGYLNDASLFMITVTFYVCDLICVLVWCPFRLIMKNQCCTTCRIFNWDHLMMFTPMITISGFFARSCLITSIIVFLVWEICTIIHPERFWEMSNTSLSCASCTDKLCTQYCQKLRKPSHI